MSGLIYSSSGSEHQPDSACLGDMVAVFMEDETAALVADQSLERLSPQPETMESNISEDCQTAVQSEENQFEILKGIISCTCPAELDLLAQTVKCGLEMTKKLLQQQPDCLRQSVMCHLRNVGYDAAICKSLPKDNNRKFPSGNYEYIDVILKSTNSGRSIRLFVDFDFRSQFEIARPTREYSALLELLPKIYVGRDQRLQAIVKIMCEGVKNSLKKRGMHLPPWRKYKYMHSMWLGSYKRTAACNSHQDHVLDGYDSSKTSTETSPVTLDLMGMGMGMGCLKHEIRRMSKHVCNTVHAAGHVDVDVTEEYQNWGSPAGGIVLSKPSTGKLIISTLACALMEAGLTSLSTTAEPERLCLPEALTKVAIA